MRAATNREFRPQYVDWSTADVEVMLKTMREWWETAGREQVDKVAADAHALTPLIRRPIEERINRMLQVLLLIIIPRVTLASAEAGELLDFVHDIEQHGFPVAVILPALLLLRPDDNTASNLRHSLASLDQQTYLFALRGLVYWLENRPSPQRPEQSPQLPAPPPDLTSRTRGTIVAGRAPTTGLLHLQLSTLRTSTILRYVHTHTHTTCLKPPTSVSEHP